MTNSWSRTHLNFSGPVGVSAVVPNDDAAGPILPFGDYSLELRVFHRVVLGAPRHPPDLRICRRAFGDRPRHQHAVDLEAKVVVVTAGRMMLNDETRPATASPTSPRLPIAWLGAAARPPLAPVFA